MEIRFGQFVFRPSLLATAFLLIGMPILVSLGLWQLDRADQKQAILSDHARTTTREALRLESIRGDWAAFEHQPVEARGQYDPERIFLLDNRTYLGQAGYRVLMPLLLAGGERAVLVNRGWVKAPPSRSDLPDLPTPAGELRLSGQITLPPRRSFRLGDAEEPGRGSVRIIQTIDLEAIAGMLDVELVPVVLMLDKGQPSGFVYDYQPVYGIGPAKHRAYALQWFSIALLLGLFYIGVCTRRDGRSESEE